MRQTYVNKDMVIGEEIRQVDETLWLFDGADDGDITSTICSACIR